MPNRNGSSIVSRFPCCSYQSFSVQTSFEIDLERPSKKKNTMQPDRSTHGKSSVRKPFEVNTQENDNRHNIGQVTTMLCEQVVKSTKENAQMVFHNLEKRDCLAPFDLHEIKLSKQILGHGEFSNVYKVVAFKPKQNDTINNNLTLDEHNARLFLTRNSKRSKSNMKRYAVKHLRPQLMDDTENFYVGARDLALEAQLLACIDHPNIAKIRGCAKDGIEGYSSGLNTGYFLILDRLQGTLYDRIRSWTTREQKYSTQILNKLLNRIGLKRKNNWTDRLKICFDLAGALRYLHDHSIIFRDLKPQNIGFDIRGDVKLFDFGLAKFLPPGADSIDETYDLSGAGSLRYMAPEAVKGENYNLKADVYGFALICWAALSYSIPFDGYSSEMIIEGVVDQGINGDRPQLQHEWPNEIQRMLEKGWSHNPCKRPMMKSWYTLFLAQLRKLGYGNDVLDHKRRRSSFIMTPGTRSAKTQCVTPTTDCL